MVVFMATKSCLKIDFAASAGQRTPPWGMLQPRTFREGQYSHGPGEVKLSESRAVAPDTREHAGGSWTKSRTVHISNEDELSAQGAGR